MLFSYNISLSSPSPHYTAIKPPRDKPGGREDGWTAEIFNDIPEVWFIRLGLG
jgi:hypothetical protein